jgi:hypothetical protein
VSQKKLEIEKKNSESQEKKETHRQHFDLMRQARRHLRRLIPAQPVGRGHGRDGVAQGPAG